MHHPLLSSILLAALATGCQPGHAERAPAPKPAPAPASKPAPAREPPAPPRTDYDAMRFHMHQSFDLVRAIERLLIRGELAYAKRFAEAIAAAPDAPAHGPWAAHAVLVRDRAADLARATTVADACVRDAKLAAACARCHVELGVTPAFTTHPTPPPDQPTVEARMLRHRWAADRLWEGIIGGADEPWRAGLDVLAAPSLDWRAIAPGRVEHGKRLQRLASAARMNKRLDLDGRAAAYGEMLATCAACHTAPAAPRKPAPRRAPTPR